MGSRLQKASVALELLLEEVDAVAVGQGHDARSASGASDGVVVCELRRSFPLRVERVDGIGGRTPKVSSTAPTATSNRSIGEN